MADERAPQIVTGDPDVTRASLELKLPAALLPGLVRRAVQSTPGFSVTAADEEGAELLRRSATASDRDVVRLVFTPTDQGIRVTGEVHSPAGTIGASVKKRDADTTALFQAIASAAGPF
ncbi:hypothetical protein ABID92_000098 [Frigoribacterium sp. PvP120]|jgi:hypothetical protein|uniref:hypothetical protein n=1 Tax=unclassified Frigoribacterium TaxID=2627005 RepID=UPI001AE10494|nr:hypothetical protein [Frigoribacterium sp. PvP121]MBP1242075.1 hypothetical protein [Frigoribacterium sp. PvP121]